MESSKIISKTSGKHATCDDYLQGDKKVEIKEFKNGLRNHWTIALYVAPLAYGTSRKTSKGQTIKKQNNDVTI
jgi:hypothetical protein